jgi:hypothetical protein
MQLKTYVADVMEQLRDFIPDGGEVRFEVAPIAEAPGEVMVDVGYRNTSTHETLVFSVPMTESRVSMPAILTAHRN